MLHGKKAAQNSEQAAKEAFSGSSLGSNLPSIKIKLKNRNKEMNIVDLVVFSKLENSKSEIRRLIKGNAVKINDKIILNEKLIITNNFIILFKLILKKWVWYLHINPTASGLTSNFVKQFVAWWCPS